MLIVLGSTKGSGKKLLRIRLEASVDIGNGLLAERQIKTERKHKVV